MGAVFPFALIGLAPASIPVARVDSVFANINDATPARVVPAGFGFGLQIHLDFTGYVDMARGISRTVGIELMLNVLWARARSLPAKPSRKCEYWASRSAGL